LKTVNYTQQFWVLVKIYSPALLVALHSQVPTSSALIDSTLSKTSLTALNLKITLSDPQIGNDCDEISLFENAIQFKVAKSDV
jgi:hypothetical protein